MTMMVIHLYNAKGRYVTKEEGHIWYLLLLQNPNLMKPNPQPDLPERVEKLRFSQSAKSSL